jgi:histone acetyltransferase MYST1
MEKEHSELTKVKNIQCIRLGKWEVDCWYFSPYPDEFCVDLLYICEFTLKYFRRESSYLRHLQQCRSRCPPGRRVYHDPVDRLDIYEVDGRDHKEYCQNLCLLSKLFLDHKTLYFDVDPFLFYVLCEVDDGGSHIVGYFSKEKTSPEGYNLACIMTLPPYQRRGFGKFLISFSYELTKLEGKVGSPEKPLSDLGLRSYRSYWAHMVMAELYAARSLKNGRTINDLSERTGIKVEDIVTTLQAIGVLKTWSGQYVVSVTDEVVEKYAFSADRLCRPKYIIWGGEDDEDDGESDE